jgi:ABC-2 type transport system ATP-binding protein
VGFGALVAVDGVGFHIDAGETYGLLGPNGAGKTTAISMIAGLLERDDGEVVVAGEPISTHAVRAKRAIGYVPQDLAIYPDLSAREDLVFFARLYGMPTAEAKRRSDEVLKVIGLADRAKDQTKTYSGGMKRRLNIGIGLLHHSKLLILDETVGVDPQSRDSILESVEGLSGAGMAVLYTTHYMEEAERLCDRVGIIDHGRLIAEGTPRKLVSLVGERDRGACRRQAIWPRPWSSWPPSPNSASPARPTGPSTWWWRMPVSTCPPSSRRRRGRERPSARWRSPSRTWKRSSST